MWLQAFASILLALSSTPISDSVCVSFFFFSSRRRHTRLQGDWSSDVCSSDLLADELGRAIDRGALRAGDRLPSVRRLAEERSVSVSTVVEAYVRLENAGLIEIGRASCRERV